MKNKICNLIDNLIFIIVCAYSLIAPLYKGLFEVIYGKSIFFVTTTVIMLFVLKSILKKQKITLDKHSIIVLFLPVFYLIPVLFNTDIFGYSFNAFYSYFSLFILMVITAKNLTPSKMKMFLHFIIASGITTILVSVSIIFYKDFFESFGIISRYGDFFKCSIDRLYGTFVYPNALSTFITICYFLTLYFLVNSKDKIVKIYYLLFIFVFAAGLTLTLSKIVVFHFLLLNLVVFIFYLKRKEFNKLKIMISLLLAVVVPTLLFVNEFRTAFFSGNLNYALTLLLLCAVFFVGMYSLFMKIIGKNKLINAIIITLALLTYLGIFLFPIGRPLRVSDVRSTSSFIIYDFMGFKNNTNYTISVDVENSGRVEYAALLLKRLYVDDNSMNREVVDYYVLDKNSNKIVMNFKTENKFEFYYFELANINVDGDYTVDNLIVTDKDKKVSERHELDYYLLPSSLANQLYSVKNDKDSLYGRKDVYIDCLEIASKHIFTGEGLDTFKYYSLKYKYTHRATEEHSHIFKLLVETGIFSLVYYLFIVVVGILSLVKNRKDERLFFYGIVFISLFLNSLFDFNLSYAVNYAYLVFFFIMMNKSEHLDTK